MRRVPCRLGVREDIRSRRHVRLGGVTLSARREEGTSGRPMMCSRSRTGGGPPSGTSASKKRLTEKVEHGGDAMIAAYVPAEQRSRSLE
eukprot:6208433-Pleurochrysis_carterae.AAC.3